jgi:hypothetical protein
MQNHKKGINAGGLQLGPGKGISGKQHLGLWDPGKRSQRWLAGKCLIRYPTEFNPKPSHPFRNPNPDHHLIYGLGRVIGLELARACAGLKLRRNKSK